MTKKMFNVYESTEDVVQFFIDNALSYTKIETALIDSRYGLQVIRLEVEYSEQDGDRIFWVNAQTWNSEDIEALRDYVEDVFFS